MTSGNPIPKLITFDGEARSGKGTIVQACKDYIRDELGLKVMLIDRGQTFRCLVVAASKAGVNLDKSDEIDAFLADDTNAEASVQFVKNVYHMEKAERDALLYTNQVGADSAKVGARPLSQEFVFELTKKWLRDAREEGYEVVLLDGRALEEAGIALEEANLCDFITGLYFVCQPEVGARRTLGYAKRQYDELVPEERAAVDHLVAQINARNDADRMRAVQPIVRPKGPYITLPEDLSIDANADRFMATVDTSADMSKSQMSAPIIRLISDVLIN